MADETPAETAVPALPLLPAESDAYGYCDAATGMCALPLAEQPLNQAPGSAASEPVGIPVTDPSDTVLEVEGRPHRG